MIRKNPFGDVIGRLMRILAILALVMPSSLLADDGILNPSEMAISDAHDRPASIAVCMSGYYLTKGGNHSPALDLHEKCADAGYTRSMLWLSYVYQNGYGVEISPEKSAKWDLRAAEAGNEVGMFNYGLDLLRGYGVEQNADEGKKWVDKASQSGHKHATELKAANYNLSVVTPDTDEAFYQSF